MNADLQITDPITTIGRCGEQVPVWAYAGHVVVEIIEGGDCIDAHLTIAGARQHIENVKRQIAAALRMSGCSLELVP